MAIFLDNQTGEFTTDEGGYTSTVYGTDGGQITTKH